MSIKRSPQEAILNQSFYRQKSKEGEFNSINFVEKYLTKHGIDEMLKGSFGELAKSKQLPQNPYAMIYRTLSLDVYVKNLETYFEETPDRKMLMNHLISNGANPLSAEIQIDNERSVYSSESFLVNVSRKACETMIKYYYKQPAIRDTRVAQVLPCLSGTALLTNPMLEYPQTSRSPIELVYYLIFTGSVESSASIFAEIVVSEALRLIKITDPTVCFTSLTIQQISYIDYKSSFIWTRPDILLYKTKLNKEITRSVVTSGEVVITTLELYSGGNVGQGAYRYIRRRYAMVGRNEGAYANMEVYPLSSVFRGAFLKKADLDTYLSFHKVEEGNETQLLEMFLVDQSARILKYIFLQDLRTATWETFYFCSVQENQDFEQLLDKLVMNILAGEVSELAYIQAELQVCLGRLDYRLYNDKNQIDVFLEQTLAKLKGILEKGRNTYVLTFRQLFIKLSAHILDSMKQKNYRQKLRSYLLHLVNTLHCIVLNCDQIQYGLRAQNFKHMVDYLEEVQQGQTHPIVKFEDVMNNKQSPAVVVVSEQVQRIKQQYNIATDREASDLVFTSYLREFGYFDNIYMFYIELFFGSKPGYPLAHLLSSISEFSFHTQYFGLVPHQIQEMFTHQPIRQIALTSELTIDSVREMGFEIVGFHGNVRYVNIEELRKLKEFIDMMVMNRSQLKIPLNCEVSEIFSVSGENLLSSSTYIDQVLTTLYINIDIIVRGGTSKQVDNIFYDLLMQKCRSIESHENMGVVGLFSHRDRAETFKIYDNKLPFTMEEFKQFAESVEAMYLKMILMVEDKIKVINYRINIHSIKSENQNQIVHLHNTTPFHTRNRVFFNSKDILQWYRINEVKDSIQQKFTYYDDLDMNACVKQYIITSLHIMIDQPQTKQSVESIVQILYYYTQKMYFLSRQMLNFYYLIQYIKKDRTGKFEIQQTKSCVQLLIENIIGITEKYGYCCNEGLSVSLAQHCNTINTYIEKHPHHNGDQRELSFLQQIVMQVCQILEHNCNTVYLEYRTILKKTNQKLQLII